MTLLGITNSPVKPLQPLQAPSPMLVTVLGIVTEVKLLQLSKAKLPMLVTLLPIVTEVKLRQLLKASCPMLVTLLPITTYWIEEREEYHGTEGTLL